MPSSVLCRRAFATVSATAPGTAAAAPRHAARAAATSLVTRDVDCLCAPLIGLPTPGALGSDGAAARSVALCLIFLGAALA